MTSGGPDAESASGRVGAILTIDLGAIVDNYRLLKARLGATVCGAAIKADAYGLGMAAVAPVLWTAGCRDYFVATIDEGLELRSLLPEAEIHVLGGVGADEAAVVVAARLHPVLNSLEEIAIWSTAAGRRSGILAATVHIDTGMSRLGLPPRELDRLVAEPERLSGIDVTVVMSHLACPDLPAHPLNAAQLASFRAATARFRPARARLSLANSSAIFLERDYHFDLTRPGAALYGINPVPGQPNPLRQVVRLQGKILQLRDVDTDTSVGYGATHRVTRPTRLATVGVGYADGYLRSLSNRGSAILGGRRIPVVGRVSMDLITLDVSDVPTPELRPGALVDLIGPDNPLDDLAAQADTIGYEILTSLGRRYARRYVAANAAG
jgi:alanine racemase